MIVAKLWLWFVEVCWRYNKKILSLCITFTSIMPACAHASSFLQPVGSKENVRSAGLYISSAGILVELPFFLSPCWSCELMLSRHSTTASHEGSTGSKCRRHRLGVWALQLLAASDVSCTVRIHIECKKMHYRFTSLPLDLVSNFLLFYWFGIRHVLG